MRQRSLFAFLALVVGGGLVIGALTTPGEWYEGLNKPTFNPPGWIFGPVWTILYVLVAVAGWRIWRRERTGPAMRLWWGQLALNFLWSPIFFRAHAIGLALVIVVALLLTILAFAAAARRRDAVAAWCAVPYAAWVAFATVLNGALLVLNPQA